MDLARLRKKLKEKQNPPDKPPGQPEAEETPTDLPDEKDTPPGAQEAEGEKTVEAATREEEVVVSERTDEGQEEALLEALLPTRIEATSPQAEATPEEEKEPKPPAPPAVPEEKAAAEAEQSQGEGEQEYPDFIPEEQRGIVELIAFKLSREDYAFRISEVEEILKPQNITGVPRVGAHVLGISSLRGKIIPLISLRKRFALKEDIAASGRDERVIILYGPKGSVGALVDKVVGVLRIPEDSIQEPPGHLSETEVKYIEGIALWEGKFISIIRTGEALSVLKEA